MNKKTFVIYTTAIILITAFITFIISGFLFSGFFYDKTARDNNSKYSKLTKAMDIIKNNYLKDVNDNELIEGAVRGLVEATKDPYTTYLNEKELEEFLTYTEGEYSGIGVVVAPDAKDNLITVVSPIEDTPAQKAGIITGDKIIKVDGKEVYANKLDEAVSKIKGEKNTEVTLTILRESKEPYDIKIKRATVVLKTVKSKVLENNIGFVRITMFDQHTHTEFINAVEDLKKKAVKSIIIDLRDNPGGLLDSCVKICDYILPQGTIVYTEDKFGKKDTKYSDKKELDFKIAVLVNEGSASASEIMSGALKDYSKAKIIGTKTYGKGLVQTIIPIDKKTGVKVTISEYFTPKGTKIDKIGVIPDILVELPSEFKNVNTSQIPVEKDLQLQKAIEILK